LDRAAPSRLMSAFPEGVVVHRVGLAKAVEETRLFLHEEGLVPPGGPGVS
jgi:ATP-dependent DNA helicase DinG